MSKNSVKLDEKAYIGGTIKCITLRLADNDREGFIRHARKLKEEFPFEDKLERLPYHLQPEYAKKLSVYLEPLKSKSALEVFATELALPPSVAHEIALSTSGLESALIDAISLDKVLYQPTNIIQFDEGKTTFIYSLDSTINFFRLMLGKDPSGTLSLKGLEALIGNPSIEQANLKLDDLLSLDDAHQVLLTIQGKNNEEKTLLSMLGKFDQRLAEIVRLTDSFLEKASRHARNKPYEKLKSIHAISMGTVRRLINNSLPQYANMQIKHNALPFDFYSEAEELLSNLPTLTKESVQSSFDHCLSLFSHSAVKCSLGPYFMLAHKMNIELLVPKDPTAIYYYLQGFSAYMKQEDNNKAILDWAPGFFDQSLKKMSDADIKQHRLSEKAPYAVAVGSNRLKRMTLENDLGM
jgi:hypothetical protein